jgi:hypothetical protein
MKRITLGLVSALAGIVSIPTTADAQQIAYGLNLTGQSFQTFDVTAPNNLSTATSITGLQANETIVGIDFRPSNSTLYGYSNQNRLYRIGLNGAATFDTAFATQATPAANGQGTDTPSPFPPSGNISIDVNPNVPTNGAVGALRIVSDTAGNLRYAFSNSTLNRDDTLSFAGNSAGGIIGVAYTNSDTDTTTGTALFYIRNDGNLYTTSAPNDGILTSVGSTGLTFSDTNVGFDIPLFDADNTAYLSANDTLYTVNLGTGLASAIGGIGGAGSEISDIAVVPEPSTNLLLLSGIGAAVFFVRRRRAQIS